MENMNGMWWGLPHVLTSDYSPFKPVDLCHTSGLPPPGPHSKISYQSLCLLPPMSLLPKIHPLCLGVSTRVGQLKFYLSKYFTKESPGSCFKHSWFLWTILWELLHLAPLHSRRTGAKLLSKNTTVSAQGQPFDGSTPHSSPLLFQIQAELCGGSGRRTISSNSQKKRLGRCLPRWTHFLRALLRRWSTWIFLLPTLALVQF